MPACRRTGARFTVGQVPVFKYLESRDVDEVGYTLRTASLMTDPESFFDERNPSDYAIFGIRWPDPPGGHAADGAGARAAGDAPPPTGCGRHARRLPGGGPIVGEDPRRPDEPRGAQRVVPPSGLAGQGIYPAVRYGSGDGDSGLRRRCRRLRRRVRGESAALDFGAAATPCGCAVRGLWCSMPPSTRGGLRPSTAGGADPVVEPALVAVDVPAGTHVVVFRYAATAAARRCSPCRCCRCSALLLLMSAPRVTLAVKAARPSHRRRNASPAVVGRRDVEPVAAAGRVPRAPARRGRCSRVRCRGRASPKSIQSVASRSVLEREDGGRAERAGAGARAGRPSADGRAAAPSPAPSHTPGRRRRRRCRRARSGHRAIRPGRTRPSSGPGPGCGGWRSG